MYNKPTVLITGHTGFVGRSLIKYLQQRFKIIGVDIIKGEVLPEHCSFYWQQLNSLPVVDAVIHLAGIAHDTSCVVDADEYYKVNVGLTEVIFNWFSGSTANSFIFFSSVKAVADHVNHGILYENADPKPTTAYGMSKLRAEAHILTNFEKNKHAKSVYVLRPCMIHGSGGQGNLNLLYQLVSKGIHWPLGAYENQRSFASIENVGFVVEQLITGNIPSGIYNMADDETISTNELIRMISGALEKKPRIIKFPKKLMAFSANIGDLLKLPLTSERLKKLTESYVVSNSKIKRALGVRHLPVSAKEGLLKTIHALKHQLK